MVSSAVALALTLLCMWIGLWSKYKLPRMPKRPVLVLTLLCILLVSTSQPYAGLEIDPSTRSQLFPYTACRSCITE